MTKFKIIFALLFLGSTILAAQNKYEREHRIRKVQFPKKVLVFINENIVDAKRFKYYKEIDSAIVSYKAKFKKDRLWYSAIFNKNDELAVMSIQITAIDIPEETFTALKKYLDTNFKKCRIQKIEQLYPITNQEDIDLTLKNTFQNLILPSINYKVQISSKKEKAAAQYEVIFDALGTFKSKRKSLPPNYDHVLY